MFTKKFILGLGLLSLLAVSATSSQAEVGYCSGAQVLMVGAQTDGKYVLLRNTRTDCNGWPLNAQHWFLLDDSAGQANAMLAAVLSAQANGGSLLVTPKISNSFVNYSSAVSVYSQTP